MIENLKNKKKVEQLTEQVATLKPTIHKWRIGVQLITPFFSMEL